MRLHTPLGTAHRPGCLRNIQFFPSPEQKSLLLSQRERPQGLLQRRRGLLERHALVTGQLILVGHRLDRILQIVFILSWPEPLPPTIADFPASIPIADATLKNGVEQRAPFGFLAHPVPLDQLEHRVLDEVHGFIDIAGRNVRHTKRPTLDSGQESIEGPSLIQSDSPPAVLENAERAEYDRFTSRYRHASTPSWRQSRLVRRR